MSSSMEDVRGVDPDFLSKFEEEFKDFQETVKQKKLFKKTNKQKSRRRGSQTPPPRKSRKRPRPHSSSNKTSNPRGNGLPSVAWESPEKKSDEQSEPEFERMDDITLITKTIQLPYLKQLKYVDMQLDMHRTLLEDREKGRAEKRARIEKGEQLVLPSPAHSSQPLQNMNTPKTFKYDDIDVKEDDGDDDGNSNSNGNSNSPTTHSPSSTPLQIGRNMFQPQTESETMSVMSFGDADGPSQSQLSGVSAPTSTELKAVSLDPAVVYKKYAPFLSMVEPDAGAMYVYAMSVGKPVLWEDMTVIPQPRHGPWFLQFIEEVYDARFKFEYGEWREGKPKNRRQKRGEKKEEIDTDLEFEGVELHRSPDEFYTFVHTHIGTSFGLRALVRQVAWDIVFTVESLSDPDGPQYLEEARLFGFFLRNVYTWKSLLFFLFARDAVQSILRVQLSAKLDKILDHKFVQRAAMTMAGGNHLQVETSIKYGGGEVVPEHSMLVVTEQHPSLGSHWNVLRLSKAACHSVCERIFHNDRVLAEYLFASLLHPEEGDPREGVLTYALLLALLEDFRAIPDEFAASMQEDDTADTVAMLQGLKEASGSDEKVAELLGQIKEESLSLQEQKNLVSGLERDNDNNKNRTSIFLSKNELWRRQKILETSEKALKAIQEHEDAAWGSVIQQSDENIRTIKREREKRRPPTVPAALFNLGEVVELMHAWTKKRREDELRSLKTLAMLKPLDVEAELERLRIKCIIHLQREWRSRLAARAAKAEADKFLEIKRQQREAKIKAQQKRDKAIAKRRAEAEIKRQHQLDAEKRKAAEEEARRLRAIKDAKLKVANKQTERRFAAKMKELTVKCFMAMKRFYRTRTLRRKVMREDTRRRMRRWHGLARTMANKKLFRDKCAGVIQRFGRYLIARNILKHARARLAKEQQIVRDFLKRIANAHAHKAFITWHHRAHQIKCARNMLKRRIGGINRMCMDAWKEATQMWVEENNVSATKLQSMYRAKTGRMNYRKKVKRHNAAGSIQRCVRAYAAKRVLYRARKKKRNDERRIQKSMMKIKMRVESQAFQSWYRLVNNKKRALRFLNRHMRDGIRVCFESWRQYAKQSILDQLNAALLIQKLWRGHTASRLGRKLLKNTRAAKIIQTSVRQFLEVDTLDWLRLYRDAATEIQRMARHLLAFKEFVRIRIANYFGAAEKGDYWTCNKAWERGEGNVTNHNGDNLLMCAARGGSKRVAKLCLRNGMDINAYNKIGLTAIHHLCRATYAGQEVMLDYLMSKGAKHKSIDFTGATPLVEAARLGHMECVKTLVECHADIDHRDNDGCSVLQIAAARNQLEVVSFLASECDADVGNIDNSGCGVLHDVATRGKYAMLGVIIPHLYDLDIQNSSGESALHLAVAGKHAECVRLLILAACDSNLIDSFGRTALHHSVFDGQIQISDLIASGDTDLTIRDEDGDTALHAAVITGNFEITKCLLGNGADHSIRNDHGDQPAHLAARKNKPKCLRILMEYEANMNMKNFDGRTPLGEARINNNRECVHLFESLFINEAEAKNKVKVEKRRLALLNGQQVPEDAQEIDDPTCARKQADWRITVPVTDVAWVRMRKGSILMRRIHKWMEYHYHNKEELEAGNANHAEECLKLGRAVPTHPILSVVFWHNTETDISVTDPPDDLIYGVWLSKTDEDGNIYWINDITMQRHEGALPPSQIHTSQIRKMRVLPHLEDADVSSSDYKTFWEEEMAEGILRRNKLKACEMIQRQYRAYRGRVYFTQLKKENIAAIQCQRVARGYLGRIAFRDRKIQIKATIIIQKNWRGRDSRQKLAEMKDYMARRRAVLRASAKINRCWRGYLPRRLKRRMIWRRDGPKFHDQWSELVGLSTVRRIIGVWDEMICPDTWDVLFYHNHVNKAAMWDKPDTVEHQDENTYEDDRMLRLQGHTRAEDQASRWLQGIWRGRIIRRTFKLMVRGARIMRSCEDEYLSDPNNPVNLCNYMLYLHVEKRNYAKARPLYARALEMMSARGPDNPFILFAYAMFVTATREEDFDEVVGYVQRARVANATGENRFNLAEKGFFRQVAVLNPTNGQAQANYAICVQFLRQDYKLAEEIYIRACEADPYDQGIVENFNNMLTKLAHKSYDGFDAFRRHQAKKAKNAAEQLAEDIAADKAAAEMIEKNEAKKRIIKWFRSDYGKKMPFWTFTPPADALAAKQKADAIKRALEAKAARKRAIANGEKFEGEDEDPDDWEECGDGRGGVYYHNLLTSESVWEKPTFAGGREPKKGAGFDGLRGGKKENVDDWEECMDDQGTHYYFNSTTKRSQWIRPIFRQKGKHPKKGAGFGDAVDEAKGGEGKDTRPKEKKSEWQEHFNEDERKYWWNTVTGESSWIVPNFYTENEEKELAVDAQYKKEKERKELAAKLKETEWELCFTETDDMYYYNTVDGESAWELDVDKEVQFARAQASMAKLQNIVGDDDGGGALASVVENKGDPADWEENHDENSGTSYWYNTKTGESSWTKP